jgi:hypothetical protein
VLDQLALQQERGRVRDAPGLLEVVRDDHDRVIPLELGDQLLEPGRGDRVERRGGLVHQDHLGLQRDRPGDAQALLLPAGQTRRRRTQAVLDLVPQSGGLQRALDALAHVVHPVQPQPGGDVVEDRQSRERHRPLEDHPDRAPHARDVDALTVEVEVVERHRSLDPRAVHLLVHPVHAPQQSRLPRARRPDQRGYRVGLAAQRHALHRLALAVVRVQVADLDHVSRFLRSASRAIRVRRNTSATSTSAAPHARCTSRSFGCPTSL